MSRDPGTECPLPLADQNRNLLLYGSIMSLGYLMAPVLYVGVVQAPLCSGLGASDTVANLPAITFFSMTVTPVLVAWLVPYVSWLKRTLVTCFLIQAASMALMAGVLWAPLAPGIKLAAIIVQAGVSGAMMPTATALLWEMIGRGVAESRRGLALSLAFGVGPLWAALGSLGSQLLIKGELGPFHLNLPEFPLNFSALFGVGAPAMLLAAGLACGLRIPLPQQEARREPLTNVIALCAGTALVMFSVWLSFAGHNKWAYGTVIVASSFFLYHFRDIFADPVLRIATVVTLLLYTGNAIPSNMSLYTEALLGNAAQEYSGQLNAMRFAFKMVAGLSLGWLLTRTNPKTGVLVTALIFVSSLVWAMLATGRAYLLAFGLYGAGELVGVYAPNYILSASSPRRMRRNMAFVTLLMAPAAPAGYLFSGISDYYGKTAEGYRISFAVCAAIVTAGIVLAWIALPARPRPKD